MPLKGFSLAFFKRNTDNGLLTEELGEYFFLNGPTSYEETYPQRISVDPTFYGYTVTDFGNDISKIHLEGEFHIYFYARPQSNVSGSSGFAADLSIQATQAVSNFTQDAISDIAPIPGLTVRTGKMEFFDFIGLLNTIRKDSSFTGVSAQSEEIILRGRLSNFKPGRGSFNYAQYGIVYRDYERRRYVEVVPAADGFTVSRSTEDTNTWKYSMTWVGLRNESQIKLDGVISDILENTQFINPAVGLANAIATIGSVLRLPLVITGALLSVTSFIKQLSKTGELIQAEYVDAKNNLNAQGKQLKNDFNEIKTSVNKSLGKKDKKSIYDKIIDQSNYNEKLFDYYSAEYQKLKQKVGQFVQQAESLFNASGVIILAPPTSSDPLGDASTMPYWDSTPFIDSEVYDYSWAAFYEGLFAEVFILFSDIDFDWYPYFVNGGETFSSIALSLLGDVSLSTPLADYNGLSVNQNIAGRVLRIPNPRPTLQTYSTNLSSSASALEERLLGQDLALSVGRGILTDSTGDLAILNGELSYINNMIDMLDYPIGSLPYWKKWGNPAVIGSMATDWERELYVDKIVDALRSDPRTGQATFERLVQDGNVMAMEFKVISIWGKQSHYFSL